MGNLNKVDCRQEKGRFVLNSPFSTLPFKFNGKTQSVTIPAGFSWDGMTVPNMVRVLFHNSDAGALESSCIHDYFYQYHQVTRATADDVLKQSLLAYGYPYLKAQAVYISVRIGGYFYW
jgi:hypothetical protein